jgi:hypothetical protein
MMKKKYTSCMTLRLQPLMDELVVNAAFEKHMTKASWIRKAIRHNLGIAGQSANATSANTPGVR